jgi:hypothetical protein
MITEAEPAHERGLRRELRFWEAIALSIGIMAPDTATGAGSIRLLPSLCGTLSVPKFA